MICQEDDLLEDARVSEIFIACDVQITIGFRRI